MEKPQFWLNRHFVGKVMSLLFNMLSRFVTAFLPGSEHLFISWLQSPSAVITGVGCHFLFQRIFLTQGMNPYLLHPLHCQVYSLHCTTWEVLLFSEVFFIWPNIPFKTVLLRSPVFKRVLSLMPVSQEQKTNKANKQKTVVWLSKLFG